MAPDAIAGSVSSLYSGFLDQVVVVDSVEDLAVEDLAALAEDLEAAAVRRAVVVRQEDGNING